MTPSTPSTTGERRDPARIEIRRGIRFRLLVTMVGLIGALVAIVTAVQIASQTSMLESELARRTALAKEVLVERARTLGANLGRQVENDIAAFNFSNPDEILKASVRDDEVLSYAVLLDVEGKCYVHTARPELRQETLRSDADLFAVAQEALAMHEIDQGSDRYLEIVVPIGAGGSRFGALRLGFSLASLDEEIVRSRGEIDAQARRLVTRSLLTSLGFVAAGSIVVLLIATRISRPLVRLTRFSHQLARGDFSAAEGALVASSDEIGLLSRAFVGMSRELKSSYEKLEEHSAELEHKVAARTEELVQKNAQLSRTLEDLRRTQDQLLESEKLAALGGLVAGVSHEINTPVGVGVTAASHLKEITKGINERFRSGAMSRSDLAHYLDVAGQSSELLLANLNRAAELIVSFKQVAVDQSSEERREFGVRRYLEEVLLSLGPTFKKTRHRIDVDCPEDLVLDGYPGVFSQIITNLLVNAVTHAYDEGVPGRIHIRVEAAGQGIRVEFQDDGRGMAPEIRDRVFEPFFTTRRGKGGSGLGLHVVYNIIHRLGGTIEVESAPGRGTTFAIALPSASGALTPPAPGSRERRAEPV